MATFAVAYRVGDERVVLSGLDSQGLADVLVYSSRFGEVCDVSVSSY